MLIGYARVSAKDQNLKFQTGALKKSGCEKIFENEASGAKAERPGLSKAFEVLRAGDTALRGMQNGVRHVFIFR
jgi:DNA invertase Pin-like site-specific DNA recombinase